MTIKRLITGMCMFMVTLAPASPGIASSNQVERAWLEAIQGRHDLTLPDWGPYTKHYIGISHVPPANPGLRFDLSVFPGLYRRKVEVPNAFFESGFHPWEAAPDLNYFCYRHELEWKDQVYADISYSRIDDHARLIRVECVNNTDLPQNLVMHLIASVNFPSLKEYAPNRPIFPGKVELPPDAMWLGALDYVDMHYARHRPSDDLVYDGKLRGEIRADEFVNGRGLGNGFGADQGDTVSYQIKLAQAISDAVLLVRYRMNAEATVALRLGGIANGIFDFKGDGRLHTRVIPLGDLPSGEQVLTLASKGGDAIDLDGFVLATAKNVTGVKFQKTEWNPNPEIIKGPRTNSVILKYHDIDDYYGLTWSYDDFEVRQFLCKELDVFFPTMVQNHTSAILKGDGEGHYTDVFLRPITLAPGSRRIINGEVCNGTRAEVEKFLAGSERSAETCEAVYRTARGQRPDLTPSPAGAPYQFSQERMAATLLCNVVYPVYTQGGYIKHSTPGRWWDCLYTWDSGFIGLGLAELDTRRAVENLNAYVQEPGAQSAFIHHGSMVPVQHYLFLELWNRTQSQELLEYFYPRLKQYYEFYVGRLGSSTMGKFKSGMLSSFDYFYNSGGWDDYPAQKFTHEKKLASRMSPVINTAQAIRIARIMLMAADALDQKTDVKTYEADIASLEQSLQKYSWDETSGYFGYVLHDTNGIPTGILKTEAGVNFNMGMDGVYPLVGGIGTAEQTGKMLARLKAPGRLWSRIGLTAVDQSAPYYRNDGYWNGTVWMPHQWFFWKTMLDLGESDFAWAIAQRGLEVWKREVDASYNCMEHFLIETGRGAGWHEFGGLSTPVLKWYAAYFRPGTLTTGFNIWIKQQQFAPDASGLKASLKIYSTGTVRDHCSIVACMNPASGYEVLWNGRPVTPKVLSAGVLSIDLPRRDDGGELIIRKRTVSHGM
ncbi:MAG: trehalase family glycosidase [Verrucomicrobiales bacterium]|nr:trehalase family glycosidase [Verrucomicrobiales bacterium]